MRRIGLTGGIASGKSTVARRLEERGVHVVDADLLAREAVAPGSEALQTISERWPGVVDGGVLDRKALGEIVFASPSARKELEGIIHPWVRREATRRMERLLDAGQERVVYMVPLLFEVGLDAELDGTILVAAPEEVQIERIIARDRISREAALARIRAQLPLEQKRARATYVIENDADLSTLEGRVDEVWDAILASGDSPNPS